MSDSIEDAMRDYADQLPPAVEFDEKPRNVAVWPQVGMFARWLGRCPKPGGATSNPPAPGWKPEFVDPAIPWNDINCVIVEIREDQRTGRARVSRLRAPDGTEFDPSIDVARCVPLVELSTIGPGSPFKVGDAVTLCPLCLRPPANEATLQGIHIIGCECVPVGYMVANPRNR